MDTDVTFDPAVEQVKKYCLGQQEVDLPTTALHFKDMAEQDLSRHFYSPFSIEFSCSL